MVKGRGKRIKHWYTHESRNFFTMCHVPDTVETGVEKKPHGLHPYDEYVRKGRLPHIWCDGCGIGISFAGMIRAIVELGLDWDSIAVVSGIGCSGRVAGYINTDGYHTLHGRAIPFAVGLKLAKPDLHVIVFSGDGDLLSIGGNHFIHAARRNIDINVICINNFNYGMTGGQMGPTTPVNSRTTTTPYGNVEHPFNLVHLAAASGAVYVARYTTLDARRITDTMKEMIQKRGFSFLEILSSCPTNYGRRNKMPTPLDEMKFYHENSMIKHGTPPEEADIAPGKPIICGKFVDIEKPTYDEIYWDMVRKAQKSRGGAR